MPELRDLLGDLAGSPGPPSRLSADSLFQAGRRQRRRRLMTTGASGVAVLLVLAVVVVAAWRPSGGADRTPAVGGSPSASPASMPAVTWAGIADAELGYVQVAVCAEPPAQCSKDTTVLLGTDDGGRTWAERGGSLVRYTIAIVGKTFLLATETSADGNSAEFRLSVDGGRAWIPLADGAAPVAAASAGGPLVCRALGNGPCKLTVVDLSSRRMAPLATQPDLIMATVVNVVDPIGRIQRVGDRIWVSGTEPVTGRAATAYSPDSGRTWSRHVFTDLPCGNDCDEVRVWSTGDGSMGHAVVDDPQRRRAYVYRQKPPGAWTRAGDVLTYGVDDRYHASFVAGDGRHLVGLVNDLRQPAGRSEIRYVALAGRSYATVGLTGLPVTTMPVRRVAPHVFYTYDHTDQRLYRSADGLRWEQFPTP